MNTPSPVIPAIALTATGTATAAIGILFAIHLDLVRGVLGKPALRGGLLALGRSFPEEFTGVP